jgi:type II secretory ATPase GspE/PulE/Tfp pilus assembly ATPase PilB-like protein
MLLRPVLIAVEIGQYISIWKPLVLFTVVLLWVRLLTWSDKDAEDAHLPRQLLNTAFFGGLLLAVLLAIYMPDFIAGLGLLLFVLGIEVAIYLTLRNKKVGLKDLGKDFNDWVQSIVGRKAKVVKAEAGQVGLIGQGGVIPPPESDSPEMPGYLASQKVLTDPMLKGASAIRLIAGTGGAQVRFAVDGFPYESPGLSREEAAAAVTYLKSVTGLDLNERRKPQSTTAKAVLNGRKTELRVKTWGSTEGESLGVDVDPKSHFEFTLDRIGLTDGQFEEMDRVIKDPVGIVLMSAPDGQGLTNLLYAALRRHDAFLQHIQTVERNPEIELEGIRQNKLPSAPAAGEETKLANWVASQEPDVIMVDRVDDQRTARELIKYAAGGKRVYIGIRAASCFEALILWDKFNNGDKNAIQHTRLVVNARLVRLLCNACKQEYSPDPDTLRKLNMSPDRVGSLFQARNTPLRDPKGNPLVCDFCKDIHFKGRIGVYEIMEVDDEVRQVLMAGRPEESVNRLKMLFKKQKRKYLQELAVALAIAGETSLQEVARVLKRGSERKPPPASASARPRGAAPSKPSR